MLPGLKTVRKEPNKAKNPVDRSWPTAEVAWLNRLRRTPAAASP